MPKTRKTIIETQGMEEIKEIQIERENEEYEESDNEEQVDECVNEEQAEESDGEEQEEESDEEQTGDEEIEETSKSLKRKAKQIIDPIPKDEYEEELEALVFGIKDHDNLQNTLNFAGKELEAANQFANKDLVFDTTGNEMFQLDTGIEEEAREDYEDEEKSEEEEEEIVEDKPVWVDEDDDEEIISMTEQKRLKKLRTVEEEDLITGEDLQTRLREQHKKMGNDANWAVPAEDDDDIMAPFRQVNGIIDKNMEIKRLNPEELPYDRCPDVTKSKPFNGAIEQTEFHPNGEILMITGKKHPISLFRIDGKENLLIKKLPTKEYKHTSAKFINGGKEIVISSDSTKFYTVDCETGEVNMSYIKNEKYRGGFDLGVVSSPNSNYLAFSSSHNSGVHLVSTQTKMLMGSVNIPDGKPCSVCFEPNEKYFYTLSSSSNVFKWDIRMLRCVQKFSDFGGFKASSMSISPNGNYLSIGSESGIVNLYDTKDLDCINPKPIKEIKNIITGIDNMTFNHDSQILALSSSFKRDQIKLFHTGTLKAFANWPAVNSPISHATSMAFSPNSGYFTIGNQNGKVLLYRLNSYSSS